EVWDIPAGKRVATMPAPDGVVWSMDSLHFHPGGRDLLGVASDGTVRVWDAATGAQRLVINPTRGGSVSAAYSPAGSRIAVWEQFHLAVYKAEKGLKEYSTPLTEPCEGLAFSPDGNRLAIWG